MLVRPVGAVKHPFKAGKEEVSAAVNPDHLQDVNRSWVRHNSPTNQERTIKMSDYQSKDDVSFSGRREDNY